MMRRFDVRSLFPLGQGRVRPEQSGPPEPPRMDPVFVLSGGGRLGGVQVGILRALANAGIRPSALVGTSAGAFNASWLAFHPDDRYHDELRLIWQELHFGRIFNRNYVKMLVNSVVKGDHIYSNAELRTLLQRFEAHNIEDAHLPLRVVATNLNSGIKTVFESGPVAPAVLASAAIPGFFPPVQIAGNLYVDGAVTANLDLETAVAFGIPDIVAIDVSATVVPDQTRTVGAVLARSLEILLRQRTVDEYERLAAGRRITLLRPGPFTMRRLGGISSTREMIGEAERTGEKLLALALDPAGRLRSGIISDEPVALTPELIATG